MTTDLKKLAEVKRWIVFENTNAEDTKGAIRLGTEVVQASDYDALLQEAAKWEQDALQKLNDYKCAMIDLKAALQEVETLRLLLGRARAELNCLGQDLEELNNGTRHYPTALLDDELMADIETALADKTTPVARHEEAAPQGKALIDKMVDRFLSWKLPDDFMPDGGISFTPIPNSWPIGTNLLTAEQARRMIEHMRALPSGYVQVPRESLKRLPLLIAQAVAEIPYRYGPEDHPDALVVGSDELMRIVERRIENMLAATPTPSDSKPGEGT